MEELAKLLKDVFDSGQLKAHGSNPYHWYDELETIFMNRCKKILKDLKKEIYE